MTPSTAGVDLGDLTAGEVNSCLAFDRTSLSIVTDICLDNSGSEPTASGGNLRVIDPWDLDPNDLRSLTFEYRVPDENHQVLREDSDK